MADRVADIALFIAARLWVLAVAVILVMGFRLAADALAPAAAPSDHPERVVIRIA